MINPIKQGFKHQSESISHLYGCLGLLAALHFLGAPHASALRRRHWDPAIPIIGCPLPKGLKGIREFDRDLIETWYGLGEQLTINQRDNEEWAPVLESKSSRTKVICVHPTSCVTMCTDSVESELGITTSNSVGISGSSGITSPCVRSLGCFADD